MPFPGAWSHLSIGLNLNIILSLALVLLSDAVVTDGGTVTFKGYDPLWQVSTTIVGCGGRYYMDGEQMIELRHPNRPADGLSPMLRDRLGDPVNYFLIKGRPPCFDGKPLMR